MNNVKNVCPSEIGLKQIREFRYGANQRIELGPDAIAQIKSGMEIIKKKVKSGEVVYGVNTGVGPFGDRSIREDQILDLQERLVLSNCAGVGSPFPPNIVRVAMLLKVCSLSSGQCGVSLSLVNNLIEAINRGFTPVVPSQGSVGASGDLAPLAHIAASLSGHGEAWFDGKKMTSKEGLRLAGIDPIRFGAKEGASLLNGTEVSTSLAIEGLFRAENALVMSILTGLLSLESVLGSSQASDPRIQEARGQTGQIRIAAVQKELLGQSEMQKLTRPRIQDPYCLRCQPAVAGAAFDTLEHIAKVLSCEVGAVTDNPIICLETEELLYGGNFHAQPIGLASDMAAMAISEIGNISERRTALLMDSKFSGLPDFLVSDAGLNSGLMLGQVTAAALVSENKHLATPCSLDSIPTGANAEDYVSMATGAGLRLLRMLDNLENILGIELLAASQGIDLRRPAKTSPALEAYWSALRAVVPVWDVDRMLAPDIEAARKIIRKGWVANDVLESLMPTINK